MDEKKLSLLNGDIFLSPERIVKGNILISDGKIASLSFSNNSERLGKTIDLKGKMVFPGFIDAHTHLLQEGIEMLRPDLSSAKSREEVFEIVRATLKNYCKGDVIIASDFDESRWKDKKIPCKEELDRVCPDNPLVIRRVCGHFAVANGMALKRISDNWRGVDRETGLMKEDVPLNLYKIFPPEDKEVREGLRKAVKKANSLGITSINEIVTTKYISFYEELGEEGQLTMNVRLYIPVNELGGIKEPKFDFQKTVFGGVKIFADGSIGARTAANTFFYKDSPNNNGMLLFSTRELDGFVKDAEELGIQLIVHAIGNRAVRQVLDAYEKYVGKDNALRHRIEHCELIDEDDIDRMQRLGIIASMQPNFIEIWSKPGGMYEYALGERFKMNNPIGVIKKRGITVAFGSDAMPLSPLLGIKGTVSAPFERQRLKKEEAVECYTRNSAFAGFSLIKEGEIKEGKEANLVVLDHNLKRIYSVFYKGVSV